MRQVDNNECGIADLGAHDVVDDACPSNVTHINKIVADTVFESRLQDFRDKWIEYGVSKLHGNKAVVA